MTLNILIVSPLLPATGNSSTVHRLQCHFLRRDFDVSLICSNELMKQTLKCNLKALDDYVCLKNINCVLILHALKSGNCTICSCSNNCELSVKYAVIFGGTDINEDTKNEKKLRLMQTCVAKSEFCVVFNNSMHILAKQFFPSAVLYQQAQALDYSLYDFHQNKVTFDCSSLNHKNSSLFLFILPCSIRSVKDPLYIIDEVFKLRNILKKDVRLLILGPVLDIDYGKKFFAKMCRVIGHFDKCKEDEFFESPFPIPSLSCSSDSYSSLHIWINNSSGSVVQYVPALYQKDYFRLLEQHQFIAVLNTSLSEGMSAAILEAMIIGVPVIARDILGNRSMIIDGKTGFLFSSPDDFIKKASLLINDHTLFLEIVNEAKTYAVKNHSPYVENNFYSDLLIQYFA